MKKRKVFLLLVAVFCLTCLLALTASAEVVGGEVTDLIDWSFDTETGALSLHGVGEMPDYQNANSVPWVSYHAQIKTVDVGRLIANVGDYAFYNCYKLESAYIPSTVTEIGTRAFYHCTSLKAIDFNNDINLNSIGAFAFAQCTALPTLDLPETLQVIGESAFGGCTALTVLEIPEGVTSIGKNVVEGCLLQEITLPYLGGARDDYANQRIGYVFGSYYPNDGNSYVPDTLRYVTLTNARSIGVSAFDGCDSLVAVSLPGGLSHIGASAFAGCASLVGVVLPQSVTEIDANAFSGCYSLAEITLPAGLTALADGLFISCRSLTEITIPTGVLTIGKETFYGCAALTQITIPAAVTAIGLDAFQGCVALTGVYITDLALWCGIDFANEGANPLMMAGALYLNGEHVTSLTVPQAVTVIKPYAFYYGNITALALPAGVTAVGAYAFYGCESLRCLSLSAGLQTVGANAFAHCTSLTSLALPEGVTAIGETAFFHCTALTEIRLPASLAQVGGYAFSDVAKNATVYLSSAAVAAMLTEKTAGGDFLSNTAQLYLTESVADIPTFLDSFFPHRDVTVAEGNTYTHFATTHTYTWKSNGEHNHQYICTCGDVEQYEAHTWDAGVVTKEATDKEDGEQQFTCTVCAEARREPLPKLKGDFDGAVIAVLAGAAVFAVLLVVFILRRKRRKA